MKKILKAPIALVLALLARGVVRKYKPRIVMITGSVGKTATKDAIAAVLSAKYFVRKSEKSYNSEFGVPFTIFGTQNPWTSPFSWLVVFKEALALLLLPNHYPNMLVLEVGADRPGDLAKIMRIATPSAVVVTRLPEIPVHVEAYATPMAVRDEEFSPAYHLPAGAPLIISSDDDNAETMSARVSARIITFGEDDDSFVRLSSIHFLHRDDAVVGMKAHVVIGEESGEVEVVGGVGKPQIFAAGAALAVANSFDMPLTDALAALSSYEPPPGRGRLFIGVSESVLIDDSYNSSPVALEAALDSLKNFPGAARKIAVLGDMLELGRYSVMEHERIGTLATDCADIVVTVGIRARRMAEAALAAGKSEENVLSFDNAREAAEKLFAMVHKGDVVLVKGSQSIRTERIVSVLLADPADQARLVRQDVEWKKLS